MGAGGGRRSRLKPLVIGGIPVQQLDGALIWNAGLAIDADGAANAYAPLGSGLAPLDALADAGKPGGWWAVLTDNGRPSGTTHSATARL